MSIENSQSYITNETARKKLKLSSTSKQVKIIFITEKWSGRGVLDPIFFPNVIYTTAEKSSSQFFFLFNKYYLTFIEHLHKRTGA